MRLAVLSLAVLLAAACTCGLGAQQAPDSAINVDFSNPVASPSHWTLTLHRDGSGHFRSERGNPQAEPGELDTPDVNRDVHVSADFAAHVFRMAEEHHWFNEKCESHLKVAFQGWKKLTYDGPEGSGSCTFNYSKDHDIESLGDELSGVAETVLEGARLEVLLQHDPLGLDKEMEYLVDASKDGRMQQVSVIKGVLEQLEADPGVLDRVRKRARTLLARLGR